MKPVFTITNKVAAALTRIERARGFLDAAKLSEDWIKDMGERALIREAHATTHIEGSRLTLEQSERLLTGHGIKELVDLAILEGRGTKTTDPNRTYVIRGDKL